MPVEASRRNHADYLIIENADNGTTILALEVLVWIYQGLINMEVLGHYVPIVIAQWGFGNTPY